MELTESKPAIGFYKVAGSIGVLILGIMTLLIAALEFWRATDGFQRFFLVPVGMGIAVIGLSYYDHRRELNQLDGKVDDKVLSKLHRTGNSMAFFGYAICEFALIFGGHHH